MDTCTIQHTTQTTHHASPVYIRRFARIDYQTAWQLMRSYTTERQASSIDEYWPLEHNPVFTLGQAGKPEHILNSGDIPVIQTDRGGQVTYHGPGQIVIYLLVDIRRKQLKIKDFVCSIEQAVLDTLQALGLNAERRISAPGVYINNAKICAIGLRIHKGCSYHGLAFNHDMDLTPFQRINPCGYQGLQVTDLRHQHVHLPRLAVEQLLLQHLAKNLIHNLHADTVSD